jgi:hypothetical protein
MRKPTKVVTNVRTKDRQLDPVSPRVASKRTIISLLSASAQNRKWMKGTGAVLPACRSSSCNSCAEGSRTLARAAATIGRPGRGQLFGSRHLDDLLLVLGFPDPI